MDNNIKNSIVSLWYRYAYKENGIDIYLDKIISQFIFIIILIVIIVIGFVKSKKNENLLRKSKHYTIGITKGVNSGLRQASTVDFIYWFNGGKYETSDTYEAFKKFIEVGGVYYVEFSPQNPTYARILLDCPVPDSIKNVPDTGWINIPCKKYGSPN